MQTTGTGSNESPVFILNRGRLDELRRAHGIETEADLARVIGVNPATLYRVSQQETVPSNAFMAKVATAFPAATFDSLFILHVPAAATEAAA